MSCSHRLLRLPNSHVRALSPWDALKNINSKGFYGYQCRYYHLTTAKLNAKEDRTLEDITESNDNVESRSRANTYYYFLDFKMFCMLRESVGFKSHT